MFFLYFWRKGSNPWWGGGEKGSTNLAYLEKGLFFAVKGKGDGGGKEDLPSIVEKSGAGTSDVERKEESGERRALYLSFSGA